VLWLPAALWLLAGCSPVQRMPVAASSGAMAAPSGIVVDPSVDLGAVSPYIFGSNYGPWVALRPETLPLAEDMGVTILRWPGGAWGDQYTVTPLQVDQFVTLARRLGAEPYIHVRFLDSTPEAAAELVRYANIEKAYNVRFWSIGNEPSLFEAAGDGWNAEEFAAEWRNFAEAMKAVDPSILLLGPEVHQFNGTPNVDPKDSAGNDWLRTFLAANGDWVDVVTVHRYPFPNNAARTSATPEELLTDSELWSGLVQRLRAVVRTETGRDLPIGVTEFNSHWSNAAGGMTTPDSFLSALWLGDVLARLIQERVDYANQFILASGVQQGHGIFQSYGPRPAYYVYMLYRHFGSQQVSATSSDPNITAVAARRNDDALTVMLINRSAEDVTLPLTIAGDWIGAHVEVLRFDNMHTAESVETLTFDANPSLTLPSESMTLLVIADGASHNK
jgi:alpha-L-arabinofuranosidase